MRPHERLSAWRHCHEMTLAIYATTESWPPGERFGLTAQVRRAAFSAAANVVEGSAKHTDRDFRRFLDISLGSLAETCYILQLARDLGYLTKEEWEGLDELAGTASKTTWGLYKLVTERMSRRSSTG